MAMKYWTMERIKGREAFEMSNEGFGLGNLLEPHLAVDEEDAPINNNQNSEMLGTDVEVNNQITYLLMRCMCLQPRWHCN